MFSAYGMDQTRARKGLAQPQAWYAGNMSTSPEQACELAGVTRVRRARPLNARIRTRALGKNMTLMTETAAASSTPHFLDAAYRTLRSRWLAAVQDPISSSRLNHPRAKPAASLTFVLMRSFLPEACRVCDP